MYKTNNLALAAALVSMGFTVADLVLMSKVGEFVFQNSPELETAVDDYWDGNLRVDPNEYHNIIKQLKSRIYEMMKNE